jgi:hypothetical protein
MQRIGLGGRGTASAVPGGLFAAPPDARPRERLDGKAGGRGNSSSVAGGIFAPDDSPTKSNGRRSQTLVSDGIFDTAVSNGDFRGGGYGGGYNKVTAAAFEGAAGGKSTNAGQIRDGHFRGGTMGFDRYAASTASRPGQFSNRPGASVNFLDSLAEAEQRDAAAKQDEQQLLSQLQDEGLDQPISEEEAVIAAAEQLAEEMGLDEAAHRQLEERLIANHRAKQQQQQQFEQYEQYEQYEQPQYGHQPMQMQMQNMPRSQTIGQQSFGQAAQEMQPVDHFRSSSRVLAPPGGGSSICFG